jgi:diguanylate cyclase (GGDEF)-like protein
MAKREELDYLAYYDPLTGLPNRTLFHHQLTQGLDAARAGGQKAAVVVFNIERFKAINDTFGTQAGDAVLRRVARLAKEAAGALTSVARLAGDQFALLVPAVGEADQAGRQLDRMLAPLLDTMLEVDGRELRVAAKAGVALFPDDGADAVAMLRNAESALKKAQATGERTVYYAPQLHERVAERLSLESRLRRAVERREFLLHFQPRVSLATNRIMGVEALLRWREGDGPMRSPAAYVPVLEETGLIQQVGQWAMREAVERHRAWLARGIAAPRIAVNLSALQLRGRGFVEEVRAALAGEGAHGLDLEITESLLMEDIEDSLRKLREIRALGIHLSLDDFGTGYSSLSYLSRLPIDTLKIDRSFVHDLAGKLENTSIITAIVSLAKSLKLKVVAEGVETEMQARILKELRCDEMQGYLFSKPVAEDALLALLAREPAGR